MNDVKEARALETSRAGRNVVAAPAAGNALVPRKLPVVADRRFLPADLEILETPPSPVRLVLILVISALVVGALAWAYYGRIDIVAVANGKIEPTGKVKVIQPFEAGKVAAVLVANGQHVKARQTLIEMDAGDAKAEQAAAQDAYNSFVAESARRRVAIAVAARGNLAPPTFEWGDDVPAPLREREEQVLAGDLGQLADAVADYDAQIRQKKVERDRIADTMAQESKLIATLQERVNMRTTLAQNGAGTKASLIDADETLKYQLTQLAIQKGQRDAAEANIDVLTRQRARAYANFIADNGQKLDEAEKQVDDWRQKLVKAKLKSARMRLTSPIDGIVYGLSVTTIGQVVAGGDELMRNRSGRRGSGDPGLSRQPGRRLCEGGTNGRGEDRVLPLHPLRRPAGDGETGFERRHPRTRGELEPSRRVEGADGQDVRRSATHAEFGFSGDAPS